MLNIMGSAFSSIRGKLNTITLVTAFVLSIMVINNYNQCEDGKGYPSSSKFVKMSYGISIMILIVCVLVFAMDIVLKVVYKK